MKSLFYRTLNTYKNKSYLWNFKIFYLVLSFQAFGPNKHNIVEKVEN